MCLIKGCGEMPKKELIVDDEHLIIVTDKDNKI
jgi:hypothetical protein